MTMGLSVFLTTFNLAALSIWSCKIGHLTMQNRAFGGTNLGIWQPLTSIFLPPDLWPLPTLFCV